MHEYVIRINIILSPFLLFDLFCIMFVDIKIKYFRIFLQFLILVGYCSLKRDNPPAMALIVVVYELPRLHFIMSFAAG